MIKAVFFDFDDTLYSHKTLQIPDSAIKAVDELNRKGIKTFLATGRTSKELTWFDLSMIHFFGKIINNGQLVYGENDEEIYRQPVEGKLKEDILQMFNEKKIPCTINTIDDIYINFVTDDVIRVYGDISSRIPEVKDYNGEDFYMSSAFYTNQEELDFLNTMPGYIFTWHNGAVDIISFESSKATGIERALKYYGISKDEAMAFGDANNDVDMLECVGIGVAMGNGTDEVKAAADYITDDIDEDGVYNALKHYKIL